MLMLVVVFATPPFWFTTAIIFALLPILFLLPYNYTEGTAASNCFLDDIFSTSSAGSGSIFLSRYIWHDWLPGGASPSHDQPGSYECSLQNHMNNRRISECDRYQPTPAFPEMSIGIERGSFRPGASGYPGF